VCEIVKPKKKCLKPHYPQCKPASGGDVSDRCHQPSAAWVLFFNKSSWSYSKWR